MRDTCTKNTKLGKRCSEFQDTVANVPREDGRCYFHGKEIDGLTSSENLVIVEDDE